MAPISCVKAAWIKARVPGGAFHMAIDILLVQDDPAQARLIREALLGAREGVFRLQWARNCTRGLERLGAQSRAGRSEFAAVLLDLFLPDCGGLETCDRFLVAAPRVPVLVLCSAHHEDIARRAVHRGAQDYLLTDHLDAHLLPKTLSLYASRQESVTQQPDRYLLHDRVQQAIALAARRGRSLGVLHLNLESEGPSNDSLSHAINDALLKSVARRLRGCLRRSDTVSRPQRDEFVILLSDLSQGQDTALCAGKVLQALRAPLTVQGRDLRVTARIGAATFPEDGAEPKTLLGRAEAAMHRSRGEKRDLLHRE
jgi:diguanylate cyclase (GGDEF)-like protein